MFQRYCTISPPHGLHILLWSAPTRKPTLPCAASPYTLPAVPVICDRDGHTVISMLCSTSIHPSSSSSSVYATPGGASRSAATQLPSSTGNRSRRMLLTRTCINRSCAHGVFPRTSEQRVALYTPPHPHQTHHPCPSTSATRRLPSLPVYFCTTSPLDPVANEYPHTNITYWLRKLTMSRFAPCLATSYIPPWVACLSVCSWHTLSATGVRSLCERRKASSHVHALPVLGRRWQG